MTELLGAQSAPLERYVRILEVMTAYPEGLAAAELGKILDFPKTTVNRLLRALEASDLIVARGKRNASFIIGNRLNRVLQSDTSWIQIACERRLEELASLLGQTCFIARMIRGKVESVAMKSPNAAVGVYVLPGVFLPWHATASGKLLMACSGKRLPSEGLEKFTASTVTDKRALKAEMAAILKRGFAVERGETVRGLATIAVRIPSDDEPELLYGLGATGPEGALLESRAEILTRMKAALPQLSAILSIKKK